MSCLADFENDADVVGKRQEMKYTIKKRAVVRCMSMRLSLSEFVRVSKSL